MNTPLHCYAHMEGMDFRKIGAWRSPSEVVVSWLRLQTPKDCIPHLLDVYKVIEQLEMLWMGIWVHPYTVTPIRVGVDFSENWGMAKSE